MRKAKASVIANISVAALGAGKMAEKPNNGKWRGGEKPSAKTGSVMKNGEEKPAAAWRNGGVAAEKVSAEMAKISAISWRMAAAGNKIGEMKMAKNNEIRKAAGEMCGGAKSNNLGRNHRRKRRRRNGVSK
jgi:hypothetical protein